MNLEEIDGIRKILEPFQPAAVYLFGSAAAGRLRPESDIDLAVLPSLSIPDGNLVQARLQLAERLGREVDLIDLDRATTVLRKEVLAHGRLLYETDTSRRSEFEMYALSDYARLNEERATVLAAHGQPLPGHA